MDIYGIEFLRIKKY